MRSRTVLPGPPDAAVDGGAGLPQRVNVSAPRSVVGRRLDRQQGRDLAVARRRRRGGRRVDLVVERRTPGRRRRRRVLLDVAARRRGGRRPDSLSLIHI